MGSVKSNIGHLKGAAGAAGILKAMFALKEKELPPSLNFQRPNPNFDFAESPFYVNTELKPWEVNPGRVRRAAVSAFGFGGTNFHIVMEEYIPGTNNRREQRSAFRSRRLSCGAGPAASLKAPLRGALVIGADSEAGLLTRLHDAADRKRRRAKRRLRRLLWNPICARKCVWRSIMAMPPNWPTKSAKALKAFEENQPARWKALRPKGIFLGKGPAPKVAFLFTGQGSQYVNMLRTLRETEPIVAKVFEEADRTMEPLLGKTPDQLHLPR